MEKITAYECSHCPKVLKSYSGIWAHEKKCFKNPDSRSCITCSGFNTVMIIDGKQLTQRENDILGFRIKGTYTMGYDMNPESDGIEFPVLNDEYKYLYDAEPSNYCSIKTSLLPKLQTQCGSHSEYLPF